MTRLQCRDLVRRRTGGDQDRTFLQPLPGPGQRAPGFFLACDEPVGIEVQHRHVSFRARDLLQGGLRTTAGKAGRRPADWRIGNRIGRIRFDPA